MIHLIIGTIEGKLGDVVYLLVAELTLYVLRPKYSRSITEDTSIPGLIPSPHINTV